jgi:hypothetical protein
MDICIKCGKEIATGIIGGDGSMICKDCFYADSCDEERKDCPVTGDQKPLEFPEEKITEENV